MTHMLDLDFNMLCPTDAYVRGRQYFIFEKSGKMAYSLCRRREISLLVNYLFYNCHFNGNFSYLDFLVILWV